jgi:hypothetical protein
VTVAAVLPLPPLAVQRRLRPLAGVRPASPADVRCSCNGAQMTIPVVTIGAGAVIADGPVLNQDCEAGAV